MPTTVNLGNKKNVTYVTGNTYQGTKTADKIICSDKDEIIYGGDGSDVITAKGGDDVIYPGGSSSRKGNVVKTGPGSDTIVIDPSGFVTIKDFDTRKDKIDVSNVAGTYGYVHKKWTYIQDDEFAYARMKGKIELYVDNNYVCASMYGCDL